MIFTAGINTIAAQGIDAHYRIVTRVGVEVRPLFLGAQRILSEKSASLGIVVSGAVITRIGATVELEGVEIARGVGETRA
jgi:hypothetical protein